MGAGSLQNLLPSFYSGEVWLERASEKTKWQAPISPRKVCFSQPVKTIIKKILILWSLASYWGCSANSLVINQAFITGKHVLCMMESCGWGLDGWACRKGFPGSVGRVCFRGSVGHQVCSDRSSDKLQCCCSIFVWCTFFFFFINWKAKYSIHLVACLEHCQIKTWWPFLGDGSTFRNSNISRLETSFLILLVNIIQSMPG